MKKIMHLAGFLFLWILGCQLQSVSGFRLRVPLPDYSATPEELLGDENSSLETVLIARLWLMQEERTFQLSYQSDHKDAPFRPGPDGYEADLEVYHLSTGSGYFVKLQTGFAVSEDGVYSRFSPLYEGVSSPFSIHFNRITSISIVLHLISPQPGEEGGIEVALHTDSSRPLLQWDEESNVIEYRVSFDQTNWESTSQDTFYTHPAPLPEGEYRLFVEGLSAISNRWEPVDLIRFIIDMTPPQPPLFALNRESDTGFFEDDGLTRLTDVLVSGFSEGHSKVVLVEEGGPVYRTEASGSGFFYIPVQLSGEGLYTFFAFAEDAAGNISIASSNYLVIVDQTSPGSPEIFLSYAGGDMDYSDTYLDWSALIANAERDPGLDIVYTQTGLQIIALSPDAYSGIRTKEVFNSGQHKLIVHEVVDGDDDAYILWELDYQVPGTEEILTAESGVHFSDLNLSFSGESECRIWCRINEEEPVISSGSLFLTAPTAGTADYRISVYQMDPAGNISPRNEVVVVIDKSVN